MTRTAMNSKLDDAIDAVARELALAMRWSHQVPVTIDADGRGAHFSLDGSDGRKAPFTLDDSAITTANAAAVARIALERAGAGAAFDVDSWQGLREVTLRPAADDSRFRVRMLPRAEFAIGCARALLEQADALREQAERRGDLQSPAQARIADRQVSALHVAAYGILLALIEDATEELLRDLADADDECALAEMSLVAMFRGVVERPRRHDVAWDVATKEPVAIGHDAESDEVLELLDRIDATGLDVGHRRPDPIATTAQQALRVGGGQR